MKHFSLFLAALCLFAAEPTLSQSALSKPQASRATLATSTAAAATKTPTEEDLAQAKLIKADITVIEKQIDEAKAESEKLSGGLIKTRIEARIAQMKYTISLLQTRQKALEVGARFVPPDVATSAVDDSLVAKIDKDIQEQRSKILETEARAAQYSGGLIRAQILSTVATMGETLALLEQRRAIAKYGLVAAPASLPSANTTTSAMPSTPKASVTKEPPLQDTIIKIRISDKQYFEQRLDKSIFFSGDYVADGLDKPARSIKGVFRVQDLFGETKLPIKWTITQPLAPGQILSFSGRGIDYNQFTNSHQWLRSISTNDIQVVFSVESIIYEDGTRRDF